MDIYDIIKTEEVAMHRQIADGLELERQGMLTRDEMETRRLLGGADLQAGMSQSMVARKYDVSRTTAWRWIRAIANDGPTGLQKRKATGRPRRLANEQLEELRNIWSAGPVASGFPNARRWTTVKFAEAIRQAFGVRYDPDHVGRIILRIGLRQKRKHRSRKHPELQAA